MATQTAAPAQSATAQPRPGHSPGRRIFLLLIAGFLGLGWLGEAFGWAAVGIGTAVAGGLGAAVVVHRRILRRRGASWRTSRRVTRQRPPRGSFRPPGMRQRTRTPGARGGSRPGSPRRSGRAGRGGSPLSRRGRAGASPTAARRRGTGSALRKTSSSRRPGGAGKAGGARSLLRRPGSRSRAGGGQRPSGRVRRHFPGRRPGAGGTARRLPFTPRRSSTRRGAVTSGRGRGSRWGGPNSSRPFRPGRLRRAALRVPGLRSAPGVRAPRTPRQRRAAHRRWINRARRVPVLRHMPGIRRPGRPSQTKRPGAIRRGLRHVPGLRALPGIRARGKTRAVRQRKPSRVPGWRWLWWPWLPRPQRTATQRRRARARLRALNPVAHVRRAWRNWRGRAARRKFIRQRLKITRRTALYWKLRRRARELRYRIRPPKPDAPRPAATKPDDEPVILVTMPPPATTAHDPGAPPPKPAPLPGQPQQQPAPTHTGGHMSDAVTEAVHSTWSWSRDAGLAGLLELLQSVEAAPKAMNDELTSVAEQLASGGNGLPVEASTAEKFREYAAQYAHLSEKARELRAQFETDQEGYLQQ